jgi:hypothetical protein
MDDIELTKKIKNLTWKIDLEKGTCESEFVHYQIIKNKDYTGLKSVWISPEIPPSVCAINEIQRSATSALKEKL